MVDVSVIIVNWNTKQLLLQCIESLLDETKKYKIEIIVVDNDSSDDSVDAVHQRFSKVKVIENEKNMGFAKANNIGIEQAKGRYICLINSDTKGLNKVLDKMIDYFDKNNDYTRLGALWPKLLDKNLGLELSGREFPSLRNAFCETFYLNKIFSKFRFFRGKELPRSFYNSINKVETIPCNYMMVSRKALKEVGNLDERFFIYAEDLDWCKRFYDLKWDIVYYPQAEAIHYRGASSAVAPAKFVREQLYAILQYSKKHHGLINQYLNRFLLIIQFSFRCFGYLLLFVIIPKKRSKIKKKLQLFLPGFFFLVFNKGQRVNK